MVSWKEAADSQDSVASDALVIPMISERSCRRLAALGNLCGVDLLGLGEVNQNARQVVGGAGVNDGTATQHLADDDLDVLIVDSNTLCTVNSLNLVDEVLLNTTAAENLKHVVRVRSTTHQTLTSGDVVAITEGALDHCIRVGLHRAADLCQTLTLRQLLVNHVVRTVVRSDGQGPEVALIRQGHGAVNGSDRRTVLRVTSLEELLNTRQTTGNIATDTTLVERTHGQLGTRLTNGLRSHNADCLADVDELAGGHGLAVALRTNMRLGSGRSARSEP